MSKVEFLIEAVVNEPSSVPTTVKRQASSVKRQASSVKRQAERVQSVSSTDEYHNITNHEFSRYEIYFHLLKIF
ncbi:hypothetical protein VSR34_37515 [Paraburkholderia sp. JHI2823]|uniref:hypothetical protein n=1 Tax=Paraburkholderia sp. JHI2823 TaxID=3112960 RepID=UPI00316E3DAB